MTETVLTHADPDPAPLGPIAYLTGEYPKVSHTFIQREADALRAAGVRILPCTIRRAPPAAVVGAHQKAEERATFCVLEAAKSPARLVRAHLAALRRDRAAWWRTARLAQRTCPPGLKAGLWQLFYFLEAGVLAEYLHANSVRHLHNHFANSSGSVAMLTSEMSGIPFSFTMHGPAEFFEPKVWRLDEKVARAAFVAAISHFCRSQLMYFSPRQHWDRIRIVHCGVTPGHYGRPERAGRKGRDGKVRITFVGRVDAVKGPVLLVEAAARLAARHPEMIVTVIGDGPDRAGAEALAARLGIADRVEFLGYQPQEAVAELLEEADMLVLPSFAEGVPVVLMEAMASRIPVVSTRIAGISELVEDGVSGYLVPPGDLETLVARIDALLSDPALRARMGAEGRAKVEAEFDLAAEAAWLREIFAGQLAGRLPEGLRPAAMFPPVPPVPARSAAGPAVEDPTAEARALPPMAALP
ncbi:MAG: glycosyltransferase [Defluviimonas sp.]|nr:glycosyltransferase [Defluviimonas sp.]